MWLCFRLVANRGADCPGGDEPFWWEGWPYGPFHTRFERSMIEGSYQIMYQMLIENRLNFLDNLKLLDILPAIRSVSDRILKIEDIKHYEKVFVC